MALWELIVAALFVVLAVAHSVLGERDIVQPLLAQSWEIALPRWAADRILRFAWHLTSVAWLGLAAIVVGVQPLVVVGLVAAVSAATIALQLPGHFAWPLFLVAAFSAGVQSGALGSAALRALGWLGVAALTLAAAVHVFWAAGGRRGLGAVLPTTGAGARLFTPTPALTVLVAGALLVQAGAAGVLLSATTPPAAVVWIAGAGTAVLAARAVGDGRYAGFTKSERSTAFARSDDRLFTPLVVLLALSGLAALLV